MDDAARAKAETLLRASAWISERGEDLITPLLDHGRIVALAPGQWAQGEGDDETGVLVVLEGTVQMLCQAPGDREILIGQAGPGVAIGQTLRFGGGPRLVTVICTQPALLLQASDRALGRIAANHPAIWEAVAALLYLQLRGLLTLLAQGALPPRQRLAARLLLLLAGAGRAGDTVTVSQQALGEMTGLTRKTVNGYLGDFERAGLLRRGYGALRLTDRAGLGRIASR
ncbi:Crp/Fnr family transcriptional regulator [Caulobacter sp. KR2-114]|uniref:Crp/Fnr family transcriptional regulator n=1 Tax=Caulobacter sp. KR2-114 TaxID=3400912 RepID=UPI003C0DB420